jgi:hypothetical protein
MPWQPAVIRSLTPADLLGCPEQPDRLAGFWPHNVAQQRLSPHSDE